MMRFLLCPVISHVDCIIPVYDMEAKIALLLNAMAGYDRGDAARIHHFLKVWALAATIGKSEHLDDSLQLILEAAALVHDIGIHVSEKKYGSSQGRYQEIEGPSEARSLLARIPGFSSEEVDRICFLVGHHHTYSDIQGMDYQILVEADFLVNIYEDRLSSDAVRHVREKIFRTRTGRELLGAMYGANPWEMACPDDCCHGGC